ncbi:MAG TPA: hypothetical protein VF841_17540 [Anaeromyxobacter sp.]
MVYCLFGLALVLVATSLGGRRRYGWRTRATVAAVATVVALALGSLLG